VGQIARSAVSLQFWGIDLDPDELTAALGHAPSREAKRGQVIRHPGGREQVMKRGVWDLRYGVPDSTEVEYKIDHSLALLTADISVWRRLTARYTPRVACRLFLDEANEGFSLSPSASKALSDRNLPIDLDIYASTDSGDEPSWPARSEE